MSTCRWAPTSLGHGEQVAQARSRALDPALGRLRTQQRGERGDLDAEVHVAGRVLLRGGGEHAQGVLAALHVAVGLGLGDRGLAEQVDGGVDAVLPQGGDRRQRVLGVGADDEALGHLLDAGGGDRGDGAARELAAGDARRPAGLGGLARVVEQLVQVAGDVGGRRARRADVDEAEERRAQRGVAHQQFLHAPLDPRGRNRARTGHAGGEIGADRTDRRLEVLEAFLGRGGHGRNPRLHGVRVPGGAGRDYSRLGRDSCRVQALQAQAEVREQAVVAAFAGRVR